MGSPGYAGGLCATAVVRAAIIDNRACALSAFSVLCGRGRGPTSAREISTGSAPSRPGSRTFRPADRAPPPGPGRAHIVPHTRGPRACAMCCPCLSVAADGAPSGRGPRALALGEVREVALPLLLRLLRRGELQLAQLEEWHQRALAAGSSPNRGIEAHLVPSKLRASFSQRSTNHLLLRLVYLVRTQRH